MSEAAMPITPAVLRWARERAGYSHEDLATKFPKIEAWEGDAAQPTYPQLERLARLFFVPSAVFFFPEPPDVPPIENSFRTLGSKQYETVPPGIRRLLHKARSLQTSLRELFGHNHGETLITRELAYDADESVDVIADGLRFRLGVSLDEQRSWRSPEVAFERWRRAFFDAGVYVFKDRFRSGDYSGFCLHHAEFPIIYVNDGNSSDRQIFTLFHEMAHLLFRTSGFDAVADDHMDDLPVDHRNIETTCNRLPARFPLPDAAIEDACQGKETTDRSAAELADHLAVGREAIHRRSRDRERVGEGHQESAARRLGKQSAKRSQTGSASYYRSKIARLGEEYVSRAFQEFHGGRIDECGLAEYLDTMPKRVSEFESFFFQRVT